MKVFLGLAILSFLPVLASANNALPHAKITRSESTEFQVKGLVWEKEIVDLFPMENQLGTHLSATIPGVANTVTYHGEKIKIQTDLKNETQKFSLDVIVPSSTSEIIINVVSDDGKNQIEKITITTDETIKKKYRLFINPSASYSMINYTETIQTPFSESAITPKLGARYLLNDNLDVSGNTFYTSTPISSNLSGIYARFFGLNLRTGYQLKLLPNPWELWMNVGYYFITMSVDQSIFGFRNMWGPQLYPTVRYHLKSGDTLGGYFKFSPIISNGSLQFSSSELALGANYSKDLNDRMQLSLIVDLSDLNLNIQNVLFIQSLTLSIGVGLTIAIL